MEPITFLSGNLRGWATEKEDGENAWEHRAPHYAALLRSLQPGLIGFQEFVPRDMDALAPALPHHEHFLGDISDREQLNPIFWDARRFAPLAKGSFWLNKWKDRKALGWDANNERTLSWVRFRDKVDDAELLFCNTHLDHVGETARQRGAQLILDFLEDFPTELPAIITADFNSSPYQPLRQAPDSSRTFGLFARAGFMDAYRSVHGVWPPPATFHGYKGAKWEPDKFGTWYIDWPLIRNLKPVAAEIIRHKRGTQPLSDHYPVYVTVTRTKQG